MKNVSILDSNYWGRGDVFQAEERLLHSLGYTLEKLDCKGEAEIIKQASQSRIFLCCGNPPITRKVLEQTLAKVIIRYGIGFNSVDLKAATDAGKIVYYMPGFCNEEIATHAAALALACLRNVGYYNQLMKAGQYPKSAGPAPRRLSGLTVGLFGFGDSAKILADMFRLGFKSRVIAFDPYVTGETAAKHGVALVDFDTLLRESDIVSLHAPLTDGTRHIFNRTAFCKMKPGAILINIARGPLVCEEDLAWALKEGKIQAAGLDVLETEPPRSDNPLLHLENVVLTPHSAFYGVESLENQHTISSMLMENFISHRKILSKYIANKEILTKLQQLWPNYEVL